MPELDLHNIKLIIWDLDNTLWNGVLSEEPVTANSLLQEAVITLTKRGIISSVLSKNDHASAESQLSEFGLLKYTVFNSINYHPKGKRAREIIEKINIRQSQVLFVDDEVFNLKEVNHYCPHINIALPTEFSERFLSMPSLPGAPDPSTARLCSYKSLEQRHDERLKGGYSNLEFIKRSRLKVNIKKAKPSESVRVVELNKRSNQLNYTKNNLSEDEARELIKTNRLYTVYAKDKYANYGLIGAYSLDGQAFLRHFFFSCRVMNMGVQENVFRYLGKPHIPEAKVSLDNLYHSEYAEVVSVRKRVISLAWPDFPRIKHLKRAELGGCDIEQISGFLKSKAHVRLITSRSKNNISTYFGSPTFLRQMVERPKEVRDAIDASLIFEQSDLPSIGALAECEAFLLSSLDEMSRGYLCHDFNGVLLPFGVLDRSRREPQAPASLKEEGFSGGIADNDFATNFSRRNLISANDFVVNLDWLLAYYKPKKLIVISPYTGGYNLFDYSEGNCELQNRAIEYANHLDNLSEKRKAIQKVSLNSFVKHQHEVIDGLHFLPVVYRRLSIEISRMLKLESAPLG